MRFSRGRFGRSLFISNRSAKRRQKKLSGLVPVQICLLEEPCPASDLSAAFFVAPLMGLQLPVATGQNDTAADIDAMQGLDSEAEEASLEAFVESISSLGAAAPGQNDTGSAAPVALKSGNDFTVTPSSVSPTLGSPLSGGLSAETPTTAVPYLPPVSVPASKPIIDPIAASPGLATSSSSAGSTPSGGIPSPAIPSAGGYEAGTATAATSFVGSLSAAPTMAAVGGNDISISTLSLTEDTGTVGDSITSNNSITGTITVEPGVMFTDVDVTIGAMTSRVSASLFLPNAAGNFTYSPGTIFGINSVQLKPVGWVMPDPNIPNDVGHVATTNSQSISYVWNYKPTAEGTTFAVLHDTSMPRTLTLADGNNDTLAASTVTQPTHGTLTWGSWSPGTPTSVQYFTYTPNAGQTQDDQFTYHVFDGFEYSDTVTVHLDVYNNAPTLNPPTMEYSIIPDSVLSLPAGTLLQGAQDMDPMETLFAKLDSPPAHGTAVVAADGSLTYTPPSGWTGQAEVGYVVSDGAADSAPATVTINVWPPPYYIAGPGPTIGQIQHVADTVEGELSANRTDIGMGESITCSIDTGSWSDIDYRMEQGVQTTVSDTIGLIEWSVSGGPGELSDTVGTSVTVTANPSTADYVLQITAIIHDAGQFAADGPVTKTLAVNVIAPRTLTVVDMLDQPNEFPAYDPNSPGFAGANTKYALTVGPTTVSFNRLGFQELVPEITFNFPNNTTVIKPPETITIGLRDPGLDLHGIKRRNVYTDTLEFYGNISSFRDTNGNLQDWSITTTIPVQYLVTGDTWQTFATNDHEKIFKPNANGKFAQGRVILTVGPDYSPDGTTTSSLGSYMGPFGPE